MRIPVITGSEHTGSVYAFFLANHAGLKDQSVVINHCCSGIPPNPLVGTLAGYEGTNLIMKVFNKNSRKLEDVPIGVSWVNSIACPATGTFVELSRGAIPSIKEVERPLPGVGKLEKECGPSRSDNGC